LLNLIACEPDTEKAFIPVEVVEELCKRAIQKWCTDDPKQQRIFDDVTKQCAVLILPKPASRAVAMRNFTRLMHVGQVTDKKKYTKKKQTNNLLTLFDQE
jgi:ribulose-5-phosphate 4-epimerase/fuculose-1-phosphate aldolase